MVSVHERIAALQHCLGQIESQLITVYFNSPGRTVETDRDWLAKQCHKEYWGGYRAARDALEAALANDLADERIAALMRYSAEEFGHYQAFAEAFAALGDGKPPPLGQSRDELDWPENRALNQLRAAQQNEFGATGRRAYALTEGGGGALYEVGAALPAQDHPANGVIAAACRRVMEEERKHRELGSVDLPDAQASADLWRYLAAQIEPRLQMRNAQFGHQWSTEHIRSLVRRKLAAAGAGEPTSPVPASIDTTQLGQPLPL